MSKEIKNAGTAAQPPQVHELKTDPDMFDAVNWPRNAPIGNECYRREATIQSGVQEVMVSNSIAQDQILNALIRGYTGPEPAKEAV